MADSFTKSTMRRFLVGTLAAALLVASQSAAAVPGALVAQVPADGVYHLTGHGWGHGRGMSQWGARYAADHGVAYRQILGFYYPGTSLRTVAQVNVRVLLEAHRHTDVRVFPEAGLRVSFTDSIGVRQTRTLPARFLTCTPTLWRAVLVGTSTALEGWCQGRWARYLSGLSSWSSVDFLPTDGTTATTLITAHGAVNRIYRGLIRGVASGGQMKAVNVVPMEAYLESVVPSEMPAEWSREVLQAQAVAARSYAAREILDSGSRYFNVYDSTKSQVYSGHLFTHPNTTAAVKATGNQQLYYGSQPALTQFSSSNGGWTADGGLAYLPKKSDPWDANQTANPRRNWTDTVTVAELQARFPAIGQLTRLVIVSRYGGGDWGGRLKDVRLEGTGGTVTITGDSAIRSAFGSYSSYFYVS